MYIPKNSTLLSDENGRQQIRLGIQGFPNTGKSFSATTFRNPVFLNFDKGLGAHVGRSDIRQIKVSEICPDKSRIKDWISDWLMSEGRKLEADQTLVIDGLSDLDTYYHDWYKANEMSFVTKSGRVDDFAEWQVKKKYFNSLFVDIKSLKCDVILICHEAEIADKPSSPGTLGSYNGKIRPLITGATKDNMCKDFTDWFRQSCQNKPLDYTKITAQSLSLWGMKSVEEFKSMCDTFTGNTIYYWQTEGDDIFDAKRSSLANAPRFISATWDSFNKYMRKVVS